MMIRDVELRDAEEHFWDLARGNVVNYVELGTGRWVTRRKRPPAVPMDEYRRLKNAFVNQWMQTWETFNRVHYPDGMPIQVGRVKRAFQRQQRRGVQGQE